MISLNGMNVENIPLNISTKQQEIFSYLQRSPFMRNYNTLHELKFELLLRENLILASLKMSEGEAVFAPFYGSKFNQRYWTRTRTGYILKPYALPSEAIADIFTNSKEYAFECSTAIVILFYYAVLQSIDVNAFNRLFSSLHVWDWSYDEDLGIITKVGTDFIPGDVLYFYNPDYENPVWIGENVVFLGEGRYFGHGIGVGTAQEMVKALNTLRKPNATKSAHMIHQYSRLNFKYLSRYAKKQL